jgi:TnpA family transposase
MIEGLVRHDSEMRVEKNFVDSHGQSEVAFAFCHLLGTARLMLRLKRMKYERPYLPAQKHSWRIPESDRCACSPYSLGSHHPAVR